MANKWIFAGSFSMLCCGGIKSVLAMELRRVEVSRTLPTQPTCTVRGPFGEREVRTNKVKKCVVCSCKPSSTRASRLYEWKLCDGNKIYYMAGGRDVIQRGFPSITEEEITYCFAHVSKEFMDGEPNAQPLAKGPNEAKEFPAPHSQAVAPVVPVKPLLKDPFTYRDTPETLEKAYCQLTSQKNCYCFEQPMYTMTVHKPAAGQMYIQNLHVECYSTLGSVKINFDSDVKEYNQDFSRLSSWSADTCSKDVLEVFKKIRNMGTRNTDDGVSFCGRGVKHTDPKTSKMYDDEGNPNDPGAEQVNK